MLIAKWKRSSYALSWSSLGRRHKEEEEEAAAIDEGHHAFPAEAGEAPEGEEEVLSIAHSLHHHHHRQCPQTSSMASPLWAA